MTGKDVIKELMEREDVTNAQLARRLNVTQATLWARLNYKNVKDIALSMFGEMVEALGYEIVLRKKAPECADEGIVVRVDAGEIEDKRGRPRKEDAPGEEAAREGVTGDE